MIMGDIHTRRCPLCELTSGPIVRSAYHADVQTYTEYPSKFAFIHAHQ